MGAFGLWVERLYPLTISLLIGVFVFSQGYKLSDINNMGELLSATVSVSSILIGFLAVMISILVTISGKRIIKRIKENNATELLSSYFYSALISGFAASISSMILTVFYDIEFRNSEWLFLIWIIIIVYFICTAFRIVLILLRILKNVINDDSNVAKVNYIRPDKAKAFPKDKRIMK